MKLYLRQFGEGGGWMKIIQIIHPCSFIIKVYSQRFADTYTLRDYQECYLFYNNDGRASDYNPNIKDFDNFYSIKRDSRDLVKIIIENNKAYICVPIMNLDSIVEIDAFHLTVNDVDYESNNYCFKSLMGDNLSRRTVNLNDVEVVNPKINPLRIIDYKQYSLGDGENAFDSNLKSNITWYNNKKFISPTFYNFGSNSRKILHLCRINNNWGNSLFKFTVRLYENSKSYNYTVYVNSNNDHKGYVINTDVKAPIPELYLVRDNDWTHWDLYFIMDSTYIIYMSDGLMEVYNEIIEELPQNAVKVNGGVCDLTTLPSHCKGVQSFDSRSNKPIWWNGTAWVDATGILAGTSTNGTFANKPTVSDNAIPVGFRYFCTDKQTTEGATDGIEIIHKGNDVWVDALGRIVS